MIGKPRDENSWQNLLAAVKIVVMRDYRNHPNPPLTLLYACIDGFSWGIDDEIRTNQAVFKMRSDYAAHNSWLNWSKKSKLWFYASSLAQKLAYVPVMYAKNLANSFPNNSEHFGHDSLHSDSSSTLADGKSFTEPPVNQVSPSSVEPSGVVYPPPAWTMGDCDSPSQQLNICINPTPRMSYSRSIHSVVQESMGKVGGVPFLGGVEYIKPDFIGKNSCVEFSKIEYSGNLPEVPTNCTLTELDSYPKGDTKLYQFGPCFLGVVPGAHSLSANNQKASLLGRHLNDPKDCRDVWQKAYDSCSLIFYEMIVCHKNRDEWLSMQPKQKRDLYTAFLKGDKPYVVQNVKNHRRNFFIKDEVLYPTKDLDKKFPRGIQGLATPALNAVLGPFMHSVSESLKTLNPKWFYTSGATADQLCQWYCDCINAGYHFIEDDFSSYDATQGAGCHLTELKFYHDFFQPNVDVSTMLKFQSRTVGYSKHFKYTCKYTRKSGDQNTSVGNTILNFIAHHYALSELGCEDYRMMAVGDDNLIAVKQQIDLSEMGCIIESLGLKPKLSQSVDRPSYCSGYFAPYKDTFLFMPTLFRRLSKIGFTVNKLPRNVSPTARMKGNMLSVPQFKVLPVFRVLYEHYNGLDVSPNYANEYEYMNKRQDVEDRCPSTDEWFCNIYGITLPMLHDFESSLRNHLIKSNGQPSCFDHPTLRSMWETNPC